MENNLEQEINLEQEKNEKNNQSLKKKALKVTSYLVVFATGIAAGMSTSSNNVAPQPNKESAGIESSADLTLTKDNVENKEEKVEEKKQEPCPVDITSIKATENSIGASEATVTYKNNGKDAVKRLEFYVCAWDTNGYPVKLRFGNANYVKCQADQPNTLPGKSDTFVWTTYSSGNSKVGKYKAVISKVEFYDGTEWVNESAEQEIDDLSNTKSS